MAVTPVDSRRVRTPALDAAAAYLLLFAPGMKRDPLVERLWQSARYLPHTVRLLGTRYRAMFTAYGRQYDPVGDDPVLADALAFIVFMFQQNRLGLLDVEQRALREDSRRLRKRYRLRRRGNTVEAVEKWRILQWLS